MSDAAARTAALSPERSVLLQAPAGSGKTTVLAQRFLRLLATVDTPEEILAITFTRKAAAEMRERVLLALEDALPDSQPDREQWQALRGAVIARAVHCGWDLNELATRLRIQTIDSLNHELARAMPVLSRLQTSLSVVDDAQALYQLAAQRTLQDADSDPAYQDDLDLLLRRLDNDWDRAAELLAQMLPRRGGWLEVLLSSPAAELGLQTELSLQRIIGETLGVAVDLLPENLLQEASALVTGAARNRIESGAKDALTQRLANGEARLRAEDGELDVWRAVADIALIADGSWRRQITVREGFPARGPTDKQFKARWSQWTADLQSVPGADQLLRLIRLLPPSRLDVSEHEALAALARVLLLAASQLQLVFRERGLVDHPEVAAVARTALHDMGEPTEQSIRQTLRVRHLLVDEFQDTSPDQIGLIKALVQGWSPGEGRSLFLVGDPMQSIYLFRDSEVGLFLHTRTHGLGQVVLEALYLQRNFRSVPQLVEWANASFPLVFPLREDIRSSAVPFLPATAARLAELAGEHAVSVLPQDGDDPEPEAAAIAAEIRRLRVHEPPPSVAVLLQKRSQAAPLLRAMRALQIPVRGVDLASLSESPAVRDLLAIGRALLHPADRAAWLAILRGPACGLLLGDIDQLCAGRSQDTIVELIGDADRLATLSQDAQQRMARCAPLLIAAWQSRHRESLATQINALWRQLGGAQACRERAELIAAEQFLLALRRLELDDPRPDGSRLDQLAAGLRDNTGSDQRDAVELMTIHRAKGLEWDVVFIPGLGRLQAADKPQLLRWLQLPVNLLQQDLLLAVHSLGEASGRDPLARYIAHLQSERVRNEKSRLAYVAVTRARQRLYLSGHAPWRKKENRRRPDSRSMLGILWPALRPYFDETVEPVSTATEPARQSEPGINWRLPGDFHTTAEGVLPQVSGLGGAAYEATTRPEFSWVGPLARATGTVVHAELERLASMPELASIDFNSRKPHFASQLAELGVTGADIGMAAQRIADRFTVLVRDEPARWLLSPAHRDAHCELRLSAVVEGGLRDVVIDRSFIDSDGQRWVVDYKTSSHRGGGLEQFLESEMERYRPQLELYVNIAGRLGPEPVRAALYFPWLGELRELVSSHG